METKRGALLPCTGVRRQRPTTSLFLLRGVGSSLNDGDVRSPSTFRIVVDVELHLLTLQQGFETVLVYRRVMHEDVIFDAVASNESVPFLIVKPFNDADRHNATSFRPTYNAQEKEVEPHGGGPTSICLKV